LRVVALVAAEKTDKRPRNPKSFAKTGKPAQNRRGLTIQSAAAGKAAQKIQERSTDESAKRSEGSPPPELPNIRKDCPASLLICKPARGDYVMKVFD
jgi:hypothetical protein